MDRVLKVKERLLKELKLYQREKEPENGSRWRLGYIDGLRHAIKVIEEENDK